MFKVKDKVISNGARLPKGKEYTVLVVTKGGLLQFERVLGSFSPDQFTLAQEKYVPNLGEECHVYFTNDTEPQLLKCVIIGAKEAFIEDPDAKSEETAYNLMKYNSNILDKEGLIFSPLVCPIQLQIDNLTALIADNNNKLITANRELLNQIEELQKQL